MELLRTADGRTFEYMEAGDRSGQPVVFLHGTPGTAGSAVLLDDAARRRGVRLLALSRPGYGATTTTAPGLLSVGQDVGELASGLGVQEFAVLGVSGGGPFALAAGAALATRVRHILIAAGPAPYHEIAPEALAPEDVEAIDLMASGDVDGAVATVTAGVRRDFDALSQLPVSEFEAAFSAMLPPTEHYFDTRPDGRSIVFADAHRALSRYDGFVRDNLSWNGLWDFDLDDVVAPVLLSYGDADAMAAPLHGEWLATRLPTGKLTIHPNADHGEVCFGLGDWLFAALE
jgi:pimeloyl-ACP methyl ester carboxylesterase